MRVFPHCFRLPLWLILAACAIAMCGARGQDNATADPLTKSLLGAWVKNGGDVITLNDDGTMTSSGGEKGSWKWTKKAERQFAVTHTSGSTYTLTLAADGQSATGKVTEGAKLGKLIELTRKVAGAPTAVAVAPAPKPAPDPRPPSTPSPETQASASALVRSHRSNLVFVTMENASGSGFIASYGNGTYLITNAHVAAGAKGAVFKSLDGTTVQIGAPAVAVGHDVFLMALKLGQNPLPVMTGVDEHVTIGDEIVVLGNAEGAGVINTITGKVVGLGPNLVEVDAPFQPGNSGSPMIHLKTGKVIGVATYALIRKYDSATKEAVKEPVIRRFGYRLDSIKKWEPVNWQGFNAQAAEMEAIEELTEDLVAFLKDLGDGKIAAGSHTNPAIKKRIDVWLASRSKKLSDTDWTAANRTLLSFLKVTCQSDIMAAQPRITYDYFRRQLDEQQKERTEIANYFAKIIDSLRQER